MVPVRATPRPTNGSTHSTYRVTLYAATIAALALAGIYLLSLPGNSGVSIDSTAPALATADQSSTRSGSEEVSPRTAVLGAGGAAAAKNREELDEEDVDPMKISEGSVSYGSGKALAYYHCGPSHVDNPELTELVLLHGAAFTKEDWRTSGILAQLCDINNEEDEGNLSVTALDLPVSADGGELGAAFDALAAARVLSGRATTFVSPSASGKALVGLGEIASGGDVAALTRIVRAWIPVAPPSVMKAPEATLLQYKTAGIPILAIHGDRDAMGKKVTERLKSLNDARGVELEGRHPVYLDSPEEFVQEVMRFLDEEGL